MSHAAANSFHYQMSETLVRKALLEGTNVSVPAQSRPAKRITKNTTQNTAQNAAQNAAQQLVAVWRRTTSGECVCLWEVKH
ncbi:MAG: hypothetical protein AAGF24_15015 [Cyanobacteria bacterium P01_H01_bin.121]